MSPILTILENIFNNQKENINLEKLNQLEETNISVKILKKNQTILPIDSTVTSISVVINGDFYVYKYTQQGELNIVDIKKAPALLGMFGLTKTKEINSGVIALTDCQVIQIPIEIFKKSIQNDSDLSLFVINHMTNMLLHDVTKMDKYYVSNPTQKLLHYVYERWEGEKPIETLILKEPKYLLASYLGISERTLFRSIKILRDDSLLNTNNKYIIITKKQADSIKNKLKEKEF